MRKVLQVISATILGIGLSTGFAAADTCSIVNGNGTDSYNKCINEETNTLKISCDNKVDVVYLNDQSAGSREVTLTGNESTGYAVSGDAGNTNTVSTLADIHCGPVAAAPVTPATSTPAAGGKGGGAPEASAAAAPAGGVGALPETGSNTAVETSVASVGILAVVAAASRFGVMAFRRNALK